MNGFWEFIAGYDLTLASVALTMWVLRGFKITRK